MKCGGRRHITPNPQKIEKKGQEPEIKTWKTCLCGKVKNDE